MQLLKMLFYRDGATQSGKSGDFPQSPCATRAAEDGESGGFLQPMYHMTRRVHVKIYYTIFHTSMTTQKTFKYIKKNSEIVRLFHCFFRAGSLNITIVVFY